MAHPLKYILLSLVTATLLFIAYKAYDAENRSVILTRQLSAGNDTSTTLHKKIDKFLEEITAGLYTNYSKTEAKSKHLEREATELHQKSIDYLYYFFTTIVLFALLFYLLDIELMVLFIGIGALMSLMSALFTPLMVVSVYKSFPILGEVTLSYESKTLYGTIGKLFATKNYLIGMLVLLFSVVIPLFKSLLIIVYGFVKESGFGRESLKVIEKIGKWSMADVFIVALMVVFFSTKQDIHTALRVETGLYFFIGYVMLSMVGSSLLPDTHKSR